jgi:hypothetical protein
VRAGGVRCKIISHFLSCLYFYRDDFAAMSLLWLRRRVYLLLSESSLLLLEELRDGELSGIEPDCHEDVLLAMDCLLEAHDKKKDVNHIFLYARTVTWTLRPWWGHRRWAPERGAVRYSASSEWYFLLSCVIYSTIILSTCLLSPRHDDACPPALAPCASTFCRRTGMG